LDLDTTWSEFSAFDAAGIPRTEAQWLIVPGIRAVLEFGNVFDPCEVIEAVKFGRLDPIELADVLQERTLRSLAIRKYSWCTLEILRVHKQWRGGRARLSPQPYTPDGVG
jgi:hypothetical protein